MQPAIPLGTILQNRYRLLSILGQGGFGRTYLAEDQGRFNERCALKEFIPAQTSAYAIDKSKELFQREASILYQIQHPQIPQFRATFEENQRLFLLQDYVEGKTYRTLLAERKALGGQFSEKEVSIFLRQLLPVLAHIHARNIIHRDISPENIILRETDQLPVLIDFGVVKELATRVQSENANIAGTTVGKIGYAPSEQMQTGRATPSSDLYALAVTVIVLLTGKEPQELLDQNTLLWNWQRWTQVSPGLALVLNKMLSRVPNDRYQSVSEVVEALESPQNPFTPKTQAVNPPPNLSQVATVGIGQPPGGNVPNTSPTPSGNTGSSPSNSFWENPLTLTLLGLVLLVVGGFAVWGVSRLVIKKPSVESTPPPLIEPSESPVYPPFTPKITPSLTPSISPTPSLSPEPSPEFSPNPIPSVLPTETGTPTLVPTFEPSALPSEEPTLVPTVVPTLRPTQPPVRPLPSQTPILRPSILIPSASPSPSPVKPEPSPVEPKPSPVEPSPVEPSPVEPSPVEPSPVEPEPSPVEPSPVEPEPSPVEPSPLP